MLADAHLYRADPVMARLIDDGGALPAKPDRRGRPDDPYGVLLRAIAGQQLSVKAAASIWQRLLDRFGGRQPTPEQILDDDPEELPAASAAPRSRTCARSPSTCSPASSSSTGCPPCPTAR